MTTRSIASRPGSRVSRSKSTAEKAVRIGDPIGDGDDDVPNRIGRGRAEQMFAQRVLVHVRALRQLTLVGAIDGGEKARLPQHPLGAAIEIGVAREVLREELLEPRDALPLPPQLIVEAHDLGDEPRPEVKRRRRAGRRRLARRGAHHHLALERRQTPRRRGQARVRRS